MQAMKKGSSRMLQTLVFIEEIADDAGRDHRIDKKNDQNQHGCLLCFDERRYRPKKKAAQWPPP